MNKLFNRADRATTYSVLDAYFHDTVNCTFNSNLFFANVSQLASVIEANAFKAGAKACLDMIHCLFMENDSTGKE